jgi:hypothetical protein
LRAACAFSSSRFTKAATRSSQLRRERVLGRPKRIMQAGPRIPVGARPQRAGAGPTCWADTAPHSLERRRGLPGRLGRREAPPLDAVLACRAWSTLAEHLLDDVPARWNPQGWPSMRASFGRPLIGISSQTAGPACGILGQPCGFQACARDSGGQACSPKTENYSFDSELACARAVTFVGPPRSSAPI